MAFLVKSELSVLSQGRTAVPCRCHETRHTVHASRLTTQVKAIADVGNN
jgi:hypothetical protein